MTTVTHEEIICSTPEALFDLTQNYARRLAWDPFPESYEFHDTNEPTLGAELTVKAKNGFRMRVKYVSFNRPRVAAIEMVKGPWFFKRFAGAWQFLPESPSTSRVSFKYSVEGHPPALAPLLNRLLARSFEKHAKQRLLALKRFVESGGGNA
jgi:ribosome-associated toxin RatA of RatAB toxin-antitoxin module